MYPGEEDNSSNHLSEMQESFYSFLHSYNAVNPVIFIRKQSIIYHPGIRCIYQNQFMLSHRTDQLILIFLYGLIKGGELIPVLGHRLPGAVGLDLHNLHERRIHFQNPGGQIFQNGVLRLQNRGKPQLHTVPEGGLILSLLEILRHPAKHILGRPVLS